MGIMSGTDADFMSRKCGNFPEQVTEAKWVKKCKCGNFPELCNKMECCGHGMNLRGWYLSCKCGIRTIIVQEYGQSEYHCIDKVTDIWNNYR